MFVVRLAAAEMQVVEFGGVELGHLIERRPHDRGGEIVRPHSGERSLHGATDGRAYGGDDDGLWHRWVLSRSGASAAVRRERRTSAWRRRRRPCSGRARR